MSHATQAARYSRISEAQHDPHGPPPELALCLAILGQAVEEATLLESHCAGYKSGSAHPTRSQRQQAWEWLCADSIAPWSAVWCAEHVGLELGAVRRRVAEARATGEEIRGGYLRVRMRGAVAQGVVR